MRFSRQISYFVASCFIAGLVIVGNLIPFSGSEVHAQEGITVFGNIPAEYRLNYLIDRNERYSSNARYYLRVDGSKFDRDVIELAFTYPSEFNDAGGSIIVDDIQVRQGRNRGSDEIPTRSIRETVSYDSIARQERNTVEIIPESPIPADTDFVIVLQTVRNPRSYGYHYFNLEMFFKGDVQRQYVGTWPLEIGVN